MDNKRWSTPVDVMEDLSRASGRRLPAPCEASLQRGARPPPRLHADDGELPRASPASRAVPPPDLPGITNMIRMVQDYGDDEQTENSMKGVLSSQSAPINDFIVISKLDSRHSKRVSPSANKSAYTDDVILNSQSSPCISDRDMITTNFINDIILSSKLNPNVEEFVPKSEAFFLSSPIMDQPSCLSLLAETDSKDAACNATDINAYDSITASLQIEQQKSNHVNTKQINGSIEEKRDPLDQCQIERDELAAMLQKKINSGVHWNPLQRNCAPPAPALRLCTPRFYENCAAPEPEPETEPSADAMRSTASTAEGSLDCSETDASEAGIEADDSGPEGEEGNADGEQARAVRDAIHKVSGWLNNEPPAPAPAPPAAAPAPSPYLGPISYKRKERAAPPAPAPAPASPVPGAYVPSARAAALGRQFAAQARAREEAEAEQRPLSIFDKLERDLKLKDEALRIRAEKQREALRH